MPVSQFLMARGNEGRRIVVRPTSSSHLLCATAANLIIAGLQASPEPARDRLDNLGDERYDRTKITNERQLEHDMATEKLLMHYHYALTTPKREVKVVQEMLNFL